MSATVMVAVQVSGVGVNPKRRSEPQKQPVGQVIEQGPDVKHKKPTTSNESSNSPGKHSPNQCSL